MVKNRAAEDARAQLLSQGFSSALIDEAFENTASHDLGILLDYIEEKVGRGMAHDSESVLGVKEDRERRRKLEELARQREAKRQEMLHLRKLRDQIRADRQEMEQEREREVKRKAEETGTEKSVEVQTVAGPDECAISVLNLEDGGSFEIVMDRQAHISELLKKIEEKAGMADPEVFMGNVLIEDDRRTLNEHGLYPFATLIVKNAE